MQPESRKVATATGSSGLATAGAGRGGLDATAYFPVSDRSSRRPKPGLRELMAPLEHLLISGGDACCDPSGDRLQRIRLPPASVRGTCRLFVEHGDLDLGERLRKRRPRPRCAAIGL